MGLRFRKSINIGKGFRINLSKSGIGYSWGTKGFRTTKTATGKNRNTYTIPGTGISYVDEKGNPKSNYSEHQNSLDNYDLVEENETIKGGNVMLKILKTILKLFGGLLLFSILLAYFPVMLILGSIIAIIYLITHRQVFTEKSFIKKFGISALLLFLLLFGAAGTFGDSSNNQPEATSNLENEAAKEEKADNENIQALASVPENIPEESPATDETPAPSEDTSSKEDLQSESIPKSLSNTETPSIIAPIVVSEQPSIKEPEAVTPPEVQAPTAEDIKVYITNTGTKYHRASCRHLDESKYETTLSHAISQGYTACKTCDPPTQ